MTIRASGSCGTSIVSVTSEAKTALAPMLYAQAGVEVGAGVSTAV